MHGLAFLAGRYSPESVAWPWSRSQSHCIESDSSTSKQNIRICIVFLAMVDQWFFNIFMNKSTKWTAILMQTWYAGLANLLFFSKKLWSHSYCSMFDNWRGFICDITLKRNEIFHNCASSASWFLTRLVSFSIIKS